MDIELVRTRIAEAADVIDGLICVAFVPDTITPPTFFCGEIDVDFDQTYARGMDAIDITCRVLVSRSDTGLGQSQLGGYLAGSGDQSIKAAIEAAKGAPGQAALGGACDDLHVRRVRGYRMYELGGIAYVGAEFNVRVIGPGS